MKCGSPTVEALSPGGAAAQRRREVQLYLSKLRRLLPAARAPRRRRLSRLQVIHHVIDYICDLQHALLRHPAVGVAAGSAVTAPAVCTPPTPPATPAADERYLDEEDTYTTYRHQDALGSDGDSCPES